jgi:hypothetical protein
LELKSDNIFILTPLKPNDAQRVNSAFNINLVNEYNSNEQLEFLCVNREETKMIMENLNTISSMVKTKFFSNTNNKLLNSNSKK